MITRDFSVKEKYSLYSSWIVRITTSVLFVCSIFYFAAISFNPDQLQDVSEIWLMDSSEYALYLTAVKKNVTPGIRLSFILMDLSIILFSTTLIISFSILFFLYIIKKDFFPAVIVLLITVIQAIAAVNVFL